MIGAGGAIHAASGRSRGGIQRTVHHTVATSPSGKEIDFHDAVYSAAASPSAKGIGLFGAARATAGSIGRRKMVLTRGDFFKNDGNFMKTRVRKWYRSKKHNMESQC
eukprot:TRINITY_DN2587_c0_g1_i1.p1 TRINITY_DN2587_c0_g1~~TRINITY_DN2587_c0_g1_i1.p1  ORF type:complete len:122 (-),score=25.41 TRINITY_DN2587_c0_g1_i1:269-589(-)